MPEEKNIIDIKPASEADLAASVAKQQAKAQQTQLPIENTTKVEPIAKTDAPAAEVKETPKEQKGDTKITPEGKVEQPKPVSLKERVKPFTRKKEAPTPAEEIPPQFKSRFDEYEKKLAEREAKLKEYETDSDLEVIREAKKLGKTAFDILKEAQGEDISKLSANELYERELKASGILPADEAGEGAETTLEEEMEKFKSLPKPARDREIAEIKKKYDAANSDKQSGLLAKLKQANAEKDRAANEQAQAAQAAQQKLKKEIDAMADEYIGKEHYAVIGTPQLAESIKNFDLFNWLRNPEDGSINTDKLFDLYHYCLTSELRIDNLENQAVANHHEKLMEDFNGTGGAKTNKIVTPKTPIKTADDTFKHLAENLRPVN